MAAIVARVIRSRSSVKSRIATALPRVCAAVALIGLLIAAPGLQSRLNDSVFSERARNQIAANQLSRDSVRMGQWQIDMLDAAKAWRMSTGAGVTVAVIDSGVAAGHPDLHGQVLTGLDLVRPEGGDGTADEAGHGTTVAGLIVGRGDDGDGVVGLAPDAKVLPIRVLNGKNEYKNPAVVAEAIVWAVDKGAKVINLSLGSSLESPLLSDAIDYAFAKDVVVVACVGNAMPGGSAQVWHPAREPGVLAVTAVRPDGRLWGDALTGAETVIAAPGSGLLGARPDGYAPVDGTSFAAPLVSAAAALIRARSPEMSAANVVQRLIATARDAGTPGRDRRYGFGVVDPVAALSNDVPAVAANPLDTTPAPGRATFGSTDNRVASQPPVAASTAATPRPAYVAGGGSARNPQPIWLVGAIVGLAVLVSGSMILLRRF
ncbi:type VII secretion-associated serine protease mycosin [Allorhizocola rhizosphaerae]|uniref:type VII secretion-associated serine protease mycosin n=1 Tax=Allorhizocola rhizosphaerae TaxID=1872709 RepID=UPI000E3C9C25|nr:type VII secretion-associated serine protease mycosin [Allorhizocola rhizosphaerae]